MTSAKKRGGQPLSTDAFIAKARAVHGDTYDYSEAIYKDSRETLTIICRAHGRFPQKPNHHVHGKSGCPTCAEERRIASISTIDTPTFVSRSVELNGDRYGYDKTKYCGPLSKLTITCGVHGDFEQTPNNHLYSGSGCPDCGNEARWSATRMTVSEFASAARQIHGDAYDYSSVVYSNAMTSVSITCPSHGTFTQQPNTHLGGSGCRQCHLDTRRIDRDTFISRAREVFKREYDYSLVEAGWVPTRDRVRIICPSHGEFSTVAGEHLRGSGCAACVESQHEKLIRELLTESGVAFEAQWGHPTLRHRGPLKFDFMIPGSRTLIEYDGLFHFRVIQWPGQLREDAVAAFERGQLRDSIKTRWAAEHGWRLIRLSNPKSVRRDLVELGILPPKIHAGKAA